jgi:hypothetical protein
MIAELLTDAADQPIPGNRLLALLVLIVNVAFCPSTWDALSAWTSPYSISVPLVPVDRTVSIQVAKIRVLEVAAKVAESNRELFRNNPRDTLGEPVMDVT